MTKKVYKQIFFTVISNNSNRKILTKNLITFKNKTGLTLILWVFTEKSDFFFFGGGFHKKLIEGGIVK